MGIKWKRQSSRLRAAVVLGCIMSLVVACGGDGTSTTTAASDGGDTTTTAAELSKVRVGIIPIAALTPVYVAVEEGLFEEHGIDVEIVDLGQTEAGALLESGDIEVGLEITNTALLARNAGFDMVGVFQNEIAHETAPDSGAILIRPDSGIESLADLSGATIGIHQLGAGTTIMSQHLLRVAGVPPEDYELVEIPFPNLNDALANEQVEAVVNVDPFTTQGIASGIATALSWFFVETIPEQPIGILWATSTWVEENPEAVVGFDEAMTAAHDLLNGDPEFARAMIAEFSGLDADLLTEMPLPGWDNQVQLQKWEELIDLLVEEGALPEVVDPRSVMAEQMQTHIVDG